MSFGSPPFITPARPVSADRNSAWMLMPLAATVVVSEWPVPVIVTSAGASNSTTGARASVISVSATASACVAAMPTTTWPGRVCRLSGNTAME